MTDSALQSITLVTKNKRESAMQFSLRTCARVAGTYFLAAVVLLLSGCGGGGGGGDSGGGVAVQPVYVTSVSGSTTVDARGVYTGPTSAPGGRQNAVSWMSGGALWLFGGQGLDINGNDGPLNDLWKYDRNAGTWTWVSGSDTYNAHGSYTSSVVPGARLAAMSWVDASGKLWMFGGSGYDANISGLLSDLWSYDPNTGAWTFVNGSATVDAHSDYSGTPAPGGRNGAGTWRDASGNLWLFGGYGYDAGSTAGYLGDLWKYDVGLDEWTYVGGSSVIETAGSYGPTYSPGARWSPVTWTDANGNFWLFGGRGRDINGALGQLNDLWKYDPTHNTWTWMGGSKTRGAAGIYGTQNSAASGNMPGARESAVSWIESGNLWLAGGYGNDSVQTSADDLNDLWKYNLATGLWTWVAGSATAEARGVYGTKGNAGSSNIPGARDSAVAWTDASGGFWLFGGYGIDSAGQSGYLNDLWKYQP